MKRIALFSIGLILSLQAFSLPSIWNEQNGKIAPSEGTRSITPSEYRLYLMNETFLKDILLKSGKTFEQGVTIQLPTPDGEYIEYRVWEHSIMHPDLAAKYPEIKSYKAISVNNPDVWAVLNFGKNGFDAMIFGGTERYFIDPYSTINNGYYIVYYRKDFKRENSFDFNCGTKADPTEETFGERIEITAPRSAAKSYGSDRKTFRLALSCTGEYAKAVDGNTPTKAGVLTAMNKTLSRVNGIFEKEMNVVMQLIPNNDTLIYLDPDTDPFTASENASVGGQTQSKNQSNTASKIGTLNYDIGHVFCTGDGGIADLKGLCDVGFKARGVTGKQSPVGDAFDVDYVAHEMGHQYGAEHTFNSTGTGCGSHAVKTTAYEPGSASTIMGYAGLCTGNNVQNNSDDYFHAKSLDQITSYIKTTSPLTCGSTSAANNNAPSVPDINATYEVPKETPFELEAPVVTDADHDVLTYCWEQYDLGDFGKGLATCEYGPLFRSFTPTTSRWRIFPELEKLKQAIYSYPNEKLPTVDRQMNFRLTVRDIYQGQGVFDWSDNTVKLNVTTSSGPFRLKTPNSSTNYWRNGNSYNVTWDVANTTSAPVSCSNVDIYLSLDDGTTWMMLLANTPNDGSETITVPAGSSTASARVKVKGSGNVFFDISDERFVINDWPDSIEDIRIEDNISIFPNPAQDFIHIDIYNAIDYDFRLLNSLGQTVWKGHTTSGLDINISKMASGVYHLKIVQSSNKKQLTKQVVIQ